MDKTLIKYHKSPFSRFLFDLE